MPDLSVCSDLLFQKAVSGLAFMRGGLTVIDICAHRLFVSLFFFFTLFFLSFDNLLAAFLPQPLAASGSPDMKSVKTRPVQKPVALLF